MIQCSGIVPFFILSPRPFEKYDRIDLEGRLQVALFTMGNSFSLAVFGWGKQHSASAPTEDDDAADEVIPSGNPFKTESLKIEISKFLDLRMSRKIPLPETEIGEGSIVRLSFRSEVKLKNSMTLLEEIQKLFLRTFHLRIRITAAGESEEAHGDEEAKMNPSLRDRKKNEWMGFDWKEWICGLELAKWSLLEEVVKGDGWAISPVSDSSDDVEDEDETSPIFGITVHSQTDEILDIFPITHQKTAMDRRHKKEERSAEGSNVGMEWMRTSFWKLRSPLKFLERLNSDLIAEITSFLDLGEVFRLGRVSWRMQRSISEGIVWQKLLERDFPNVVAVDDDDDDERERRHGEGMTKSLSAWDPKQAYQIQFWLLKRED